MARKPFEGRIGIRCKLQLVEDLEDIADEDEVDFSDVVRAILSRSVQLRKAKKQKELDDNE